MREENKKLRVERDDLRRLNESLTGRLYHLQGVDDLAERLKAENAQIKEQLEECRRHNPPPSPPPINDPKVTSLDKKQSKKSSSNDKIKSELDALKIKMNSTLSSLMGQVPEAVVLLAIEALKEALSKGNVRNPSGFLASAIKNTWIPNEGYEQKVELDVFNEWFPVARSKRLVVAATKIDGVQYVFPPEGEMVMFEEMIAKYPLERLREMA